MAYRRELLLMLILVLAFAALFFITIINIRRNLPVFGLGMHYLVEDYVIIFLSVASIGRLSYAIFSH